MKEQEFNRLVEDLRDRPLPSCPENLEQTVLRQIRSSSTREANIYDWLGGWLSRPAFVAAALAVVAVSSFATVSLLSQARISEDPVAALGFDVFAQPISLPTDH